MVVAEGRTQRRTNMETTETVFDFGAGPVPAHRHTNPDGTEGGWVADTATVEPTAWVFGDAQVFGDARVSGDARVFEGEVTGVLQ
jgi:hypothetical protein